MTYDPCAGIRPFSDEDVIKGEPRIIAQNQGVAGISRDRINADQYNAIHFDVIVSGGSSAVDLTVEGCYAEGGVYTTIADPQGTRSVTVSESFDVVVGTVWAQVRLGAIPAGQNYTVWATPYVAGGMPTVNANIVVDTLSAIQVNTGALNMSGFLTIGTDGGIYQGTGSGASPTTGLRMWNDGGIGRIAGYNAGTIQWYADTDGRLYAGAGNVLLDNTGISLSGNNAQLLRLLNLTTDRDGILYSTSTPGTQLQHRNHTSIGTVYSYIDLGDAIAQIGVGASGPLLMQLNHTTGQAWWTGSSLAVGASPATAGGVRLENAAWIAARNAANNADVNMIRVDSSNNVVFGSPVAWAQVSKSGSNLNEMATRSHTVLSDIGSNTHAQIDSSIAGLGAQFTPLTTPLTSTSWDGDSYSTTAKTLIDLSAVFGMPAGIRSVLASRSIRDSGSAASTTGCYLILSPNDTNVQGLYIYCAGLANDAWTHNTAIVPCDANGDIYYQINASGASTLDAYIEMWGYWT